MWDLDTGELLRIFIGHSGEITSVTFSPDGQTLAKIWRIN
ncbi:WD40 repeat domain-containing protein [Nostoc sp. FACHB-892]